MKRRATIVTCVACALLGALGASLPARAAVSHKDRMAALRATQPVLWRIVDGSPVSSTDLLWSVLKLDEPPIRYGIEIEIEHIASVRVARNRWAVSPKLPHPSLASDSAP